MSMQNVTDFVTICIMATIMKHENLQKWLEGQSYSMIYKVFDAIK